MSTEDENIMNKTSLILRVLPDLPVSDIKECRLISKNWLKWTSAFLLTNDCLKIQLSYHGRRDIFYHPSSAVRRVHHHHHEGQEYEDNSSTFYTRTLFDLTNLLSRSSSPQSSLKHCFPCSHYLFYGGYVAHLEIANFFYRHGHLVKNLYMSSMFNEAWPMTTSSQAFCHILNITVPNLTILGIADFDFPFWLRSTTIYLPKLTIFRCGDNCASIASKILAGAPNLKTLEGLTLAQVDMVISHNKISTIKELLLFNWIRPENILRFIQARMVTEHQEDDEGVKYIAFLLDHNRDRIRGRCTKRALADAINKLLDFVRDRLEVLIFGQVPFILDIKLPIFSNLVALRLGPMAMAGWSGGGGGANDQCFKIFPDVWQNFPNLQELDFSIIDSSKDEHWDICFPSTSVDDDNKMMVMTGNFKSVHKLIFPFPVTERWLAGFQQYCPNVKTIIIACFEGGKGAGYWLRVSLPRIFRLWPNLDHIVVEIREPTDDGPLFTLDPVVVTRMMEKNFENFTEVDDSEESQTKGQSTIFHLKELKSMKFWFYNKFTLSKFPFSSQMARLYGFQLMSPDLRITVFFDHCWYTVDELQMIQALVGPYVNIKHGKL